MNCTNSDKTGLLGGLPRDMEVLTHQFEFSRQGRLLTLLTRRLVRNSNWLSATGGSGLPVKVGIVKILANLPQVPLRMKVPGYI